MLKRWQHTGLQNTSKSGPLPGCTSGCANGWWRTLRRWFSTRLHIPEQIQNGYAPICYPPGWIFLTKIQPGGFSAGTAVLDLLYLIHTRPPVISPGDTAEAVLFP